MPGRIVLSIITLLISLGVVIMSIGMPTGRGSSLTWPPNAWPLLTVGLLSILAIVILVWNLKERKEKGFEQKNEVASPDSDELRENRSLVYKRWIMVGIIFLYLFLMNYLGFIISTCVFIFVAGKYMGMTKWLNIVLLSIITTVILTLMFPIYLNIFVPRGIGIFRNFSLLFY